MASRYRVIHLRKPWWQALMHGRSYCDWYIAQRRVLFFWQEIGTFPSRTEADAACEHHAGGMLTRDGGRVVSEFERRDD